MILVQSYTFSGESCCSVSKKSDLLNFSAYFSPEVGKSSDEGCERRARRAGRGVANLEKPWSCIGKQRTFRQKLGGFSENLRTFWMLSCRGTMCVRRMGKKRGIVGRAIVWAAEVVGAEFESCVLFRRRVAAIGLLVRAAKQFLSLYCRSGGRLMQRDRQM